MPGARLTIQDREQISSWLTDGLGYAEIARRLGRPTSTISREVARNRELNGYQAAGAQQAATQRAPRRRPARTGQPESGFAEEFAARLAATGLPRMCARVFATLIVAESGSLTAHDLAQRLSVSPASISKAVAYLEDMNLLSRTPDPGTRRERYAIGDDVWQRAWQTDTNAHASVAEAAQRGIELFGADSPAGMRLRQMNQFFGWLAGQMTGTDDPLTVLAALTYAARPLTPDELAAALGWPRQRVTDCIDTARLTATQRTALQPPPPPPTR